VLFFHHIELFDYDVLNLLQAYNDVNLQIMIWKDSNNLADLHHRYYQQETFNINYERNILSRENLCYYDV
jgi:hypothetical protein